MATEGNLIGAAIALVCTVLIALFTAADFVVTEKHYHDEKETVYNEKVRQKIEEIPKLDHVATRNNGDDSVLTMRNQSPTKYSAISRVVFVISDPKYLNSIEKHYPRPQFGEGPKCGAANTTDAVVFDHGYWNGSVFVYELRVGFNVPPAHVNDFQLAINDPRLPPGIRLGGMVEFYYGSTDHIAPKTVSKIFITTRNGGQQDLTSRREVRRTSPRDQTGRRWRRNHQRVIARRF